ncbi:CSEP0400 putative effector protein [Blumeria hordei DH14]|uniref:CSEP0400 putative effector protein n=1 Tax=Blumeria graminis f. sp. hordei (strain DH14) TaxID=546991 RepID=N1JJH2_BLUG1|nr:CSEP0400 putative effector protein [Blumeria hordei DH14]
MQCIFAVLLRVAWWSSTTKLLVLVSPYQTGYYGVYDPPTNGRFPRPDDDSDIMMSVNRFMQPGTYNALYCSPNMELSQMISRIVGGLTQVMEPKNSLFGVKKGKFESCYESIRIRNKAKLKPDALKMSEIIRDTSCTEKVIASLASGNKISIHGMYSSFSPSRSTGTLFIEADKPIPMSKLIMRGHFFPRPGTYRWRAMAWYLGHLRVFGKCTDKDVWFLLDDIGDEWKSGKSIYRFLSVLNDEVGKDTILTKKSKILRRPWGDAAPRISKIDSTTAQSGDGTHYYKQKIMLGRFPASKPWGTFGSHIDCAELDPPVVLSSKNDRFGKKRFKNLHKKKETH